MLRRSGWKAAVATAATALTLFAAGPLALSGCGGSGNNALPQEEDSDAARITSISPTRYVLAGASDNGVEIVARGRNLRGSDAGIALGRADAPAARIGFAATANADGTEVRAFVSNAEIRQNFLGSGDSVTVNVRVTVNASTATGPDEQLQIVFVNPD